jgi:hypothetical protein
MGASIVELQRTECDQRHRATGWIVGGTGVLRLARLLPKPRHLRRYCYRIFSESVDRQDFGGSNILMQLDENWEQGAGGCVEPSAPRSLFRLYDSVALHAQSRRRALPNDPNQRAIARLEIVGNVGEGDRRVAHEQEP